MENIDTSLILWLNSFSGKNPLFDRVINITAGDYLLPVYASLILFWMWFSSNSNSGRVTYQLGVLISIAALGLTNFAVRAIMEIFPRARPFQDLELEILFYAPTDPSFPSNPVSVLAALAIGVSIANRKIGLALLCMAVAMAFARVYVGVSYPSDVAGGIIVGIACGLITFGISRLAAPTLKLFLRIAKVFCLA